MAGKYSKNGVLVKFRNSFPEVMSGCCDDGSLGMSPVDFMVGPREKIMYVSCLQPALQNGKNGKSDYLATIDIDPDSPKFCEVINRLYMPEPGDELHHFGWNACVSCKDPRASHKYLIIPGFFSGNIHVVDVTTDPLKPKIIKFVKGAEIAEKYDVAYPHTIHCIPNGDVMVHTLGDAKGNGKGSFYLLDGTTFEPKGLWNTGQEDIKGHDFWYQPRQNMLISTEFGAPNKFTKGFDPADVAKGFYGRKIHFWNWHERKLVETVDVGEENAIPMEIRFLHNPKATDAYIVTALGASIVHVSRSPVSFDTAGFRQTTIFSHEENKWKIKKVIGIPHKIVKNWALPFIPALITDVVISLDDKYLFLSCYLHGDVRQYDITNRGKPRMVSQVFIGGSTLTDTAVTVEKDEELSKQPDRLVVKGRSIYGGPHMVQLSRDGKRLYVSTSIITPWDKQFYPDLAKHGGVMLMLDVSSDGMKVNHDFLVDFGKEPDGPCRGHEMRYPGGDCTSDIWI